MLGSLLAGKTKNSTEKNELIVMIQPVVVDSNGDMMKASASEGERTPLGRDGQEITAPQAEQVRPAGAQKPTPAPKKNSKPKQND